MAASARRVTAPLLWIPDRGFGADPRAALAARLGSPPVVRPEQFAEVPVALAAGYLDDLGAFTRLLDVALREIVARYFDDPRIRAVYALPPALEAILAQARGRPYRIGCYRPDFIYDEAGMPRLCEIGARYPMNGWMLSARAAEAYGSTATEQRFLDELAAGYAPGETVAVVHAGEAGGELLLLGEALTERGIRLVEAHPSGLGVRGGRLHAGETPVDHVILQLDRLELALIPDLALAHLIASGAYFNDVRTLILVHDKRVLALLWDEAVMADILPPADLATLRAMLIPSWTLPDAVAGEALLARPQDMIAKRSSGGRGIDALVRSSCGEAAWRDRVRSEWAEDMYQLYLPQRGFATPHQAGPIHLVGMQLCRDGNSYGAGVFRGSDAKVINVHGDRGRVYVPVVAG